MSNDGFDEAEKERALRLLLGQACRCVGWHWHRNDNGFLQCKRCGKEVDE